MLLTPTLEFDLVAAEGDDRLSVLIDLAAPKARDPKVARPPATLQLVLDRSGSMAGGRLDAAVRAIESLLGRLSDTDRFGLVVFDDEAQALVPCGPLHDRGAIRHALARLTPGSCTNLSAGLGRGILEARRAAGEGGATVVLLSDGHANEGVTDSAALERLAVAARRERTTISTLGIGMGYDEDLLAAIARGGAGDTHFCAHADEAIPALAGEVGHLLDRVAQSVSLEVVPCAPVSSVSLYNDLPCAALGQDGMVIELGDFFAGEERRLLLEFEIPAIPSLGLARVCDLRARWLDAVTLDGHVAEVPLHVNVVPGDQVAGRIPHPTVRTERVFQSAQRAKRDASDALRRGDTGAAEARLRDAGDELSAFLPAAAPWMVDELREEAAVLGGLAQQCAAGDDAAAAKRAAADRHRKERRRGRPAA